MLLHLCVSVEAANCLILVCEYSALVPLNYLNSDYNYKGKGHFSCSERRNELVPPL